MSIENITEKILDEANKIAESSLYNANSRSLEIINEAKAQGAAIIAEASNQSNIEAATVIKRKVSAGELQARKMLLNSKQEAIKKSFEAALEKLKSMPEDKYIKFLEDEIKRIPNYNGEILLNETDKKSIGEKLVKAVNEKATGNKLVLSSKTIDASGGFVLINGYIEINSTFETILSSVKDELTTVVANALFK